MRSRGVPLATAISLLCAPLSAGWQDCRASWAIVETLARVTAVARCSFTTGGEPNTSVRLVGNFSSSPAGNPDTCTGYGYCGMSITVSPYDASTTYSSTAHYTASQGGMQFSETTFSASFTTPDPMRPRTAQEDCDATCPTACTGTPPTCGGTDDGGWSGGDGTGCQQGQFCTPLVFDLNGDGIYTTSIATSPVEFDISGDGRPDTTAWTDPVTEEGILFFDLNRNGVVDGAAELFGEATLTNTGGRARNGFEALASHDRPEHGGDADGRITPSDSVWGRLRLWVDRSHDGVASVHETYALAARGVIEIGLDYLTLPDTRDAAGNLHLLQGKFLQRNPGGAATTRAVHDVYFRVAYR